MYILTVKITFSWKEKMSAYMLGRICTYSDTSTENGSEIMKLKEGHNLQRDMIDLV